MIQATPVTFIAPCKGQVLVAGLQGQDLTEFLHCVRVYESLCKEYITAQLIFYDSGNVIENMDIAPGDLVTICFWSPPGQYIYGTPPYGQYGPMQVLKMKGEQSPDSLKYSIYTVDAIGPVFYQNLGTTMTDAGQVNMTGTAAIKQIWDQYLTADTLSILSPSMGLFGSMGEGHKNAGQKPLTAIHSIMREMISSTNSQVSNWLLYKNRGGVNLAQLPDLFGNIGPAGGYVPPPDNSAAAATAARGQQEWFVQKETWGALFNDLHLYHAIISVQAEARQGSGSGGSGSGVNIASAFQNFGMVQDIMQGSILPNVGAFTGLGGGAGALGGKGGIAGSQIMNSQVWNMLPSLKTGGQRGYAASVRDAPQLVMKVPLQTGINVTVGKGIYAYLLPPTGVPGGGIIGADTLTGSWLVTDLVHEVYTDQRQASATTVFQLNQGPGGLSDS